MTDTAEIIKKTGLPLAINKHTAAVRISGNNLTLLQRKAYNILLANAYNELPIKERHTIRICDILSCTGWHDIKKLKKDLVALSSTVVEWDILHKGDDPEKSVKEWGVAALLSEAVITDGSVLTYAYSPTMREKLFNPDVYARISLAMQNKFASKYALALYELAVDYYIQKRGQGETGWIALNDFKRLMGCEHEKKYSSYGELNRHIIIKAINEINKKSDLRVTYETQVARGKGRKVTAVKIKIRPSESKSAIYKKLHELKQEEPNHENKLAKLIRDEYLQSQNQEIHALEMQNPAYINVVLDRIKSDFDSGLNEIRNITSCTRDEIKNDSIPSGDKSKASSFPWD